MAAGLPVEFRRNDEALFRPRPWSERAGKERGGFAEGRSRRRNAAEYGGADISLRPFDEASHFADPRGIEHDSRLQK